jgi:hypothetical protein
MAKRTLTDKEVRAQIPAARARAERRRAVRARSATYDFETGRVLVELTNGCLMAFPAEFAEGLRGAEPHHLAEVQVVLDGDGLRWEGLDADLLVRELGRGVFGSRGWMSEVARELGRRGGRVRSEAKTAAARRNGQMGGRPRKHPAE